VVHDETIDLVLYSATKLRKQSRPLKNEMGPVVASIEAFQNSNSPVPSIDPQVTKEEEGRVIEAREQRWREKWLMEIWGENRTQAEIVRRRPLKSGEMFVQDGPCADFAPLLMCRECKIAASQKVKQKGIFCRFFAFRALIFKANGRIECNGFPLPQEATEKDEADWTPPTSIEVEKTVVNLEKRWNTETAVYIVANVGEQFCELRAQENSAVVDLPKGSHVAWKKPVQGVREMCDVCETTIFNFHWVCHRCGFVVCIDCHRRRPAEQEPEV